MHRSAVRWLFAIGLGFASASSALAQDGVATLSQADGVVMRLNAGAPAAVTIDVSLVDGDHIETATGRAEITFLDGTIAHLDRDTRIILTANDGIQLLRGRVSLRTSGFNEYAVQTAVAKVYVQAASIAEVRVRSNAADAFLNVISGVARVATRTGVQRVPDYYTAYVSGPASAAIVTKTASTQADDFGRWTLARTVLATSTALKGSEVAGGLNYGSYQSYGSSYYQTPYYASSSYSSYYTGSYYPGQYYSGSYYSNPYYASAYAYYNPYSYSYRHSYSHPSYRSPVHGWRGFDSSRPSHPIAVPPRASGPGGTSRGAIAVVPRR